MRTMSTPVVITTAVLATGAVLAACGGGGPAASPSPSGTASGATDGTSGGTNGSPGRTASPSPTLSPTPRQVRTAVYFLHGETLSPAPRTVAPPATAAAALRALLAGPDSYERGHQRGTAIPSGTTLRSIAVHDRVATVDLSGRYDDGGGSLSMRSRLAQVVFTATRFSGIDKVRFELDGKPATAFGGEGIALNHPVGRADFEDLAPAVLVESPLIGDTVRTPVRVWGTANTFEAVFRLRITDAAGRVAADVRVTATSGTGTRGTFDVTIPCRVHRVGSGTLTPYFDSPKDGAEVTVDTVPLNLTR